MPRDDRTRTASAPVPGIDIAAGEIRVVDGPDSGRRWTLAAEPLVLGTDEGCAIRLRDARISGRHCTISLARYGFLVRDLQSRNGTYFEGSRIGEIAVPPGAILRLGRTHLGLFAQADAATLEPSRSDRFGGLAGRGLAMRRVFTLLERAAASDATVLLGGETGTGKEVAAEAIHRASARAGGPFEVFDCGSVTPSLLAAHLFGHDRGAFTGASHDRAGVLERAHRGTVFLDEIGELPRDLQPSLLRLCESAQVTRVGGASPISVDVRIIAATRRDLAAEVLAGTFREDLYYRLQVLPITLPPLRSRREDLAVLCADILRGLGVVEPGPIDGPGLAVLAQHPFPGNVRELRNTLSRALVAAGGAAPFRVLRFELEGPAASSAAAGGGASFQEQKREVVDRFERGYLSDLLASHGGNIKLASRASGIERSQLKRLLRKHGLL